MGFEQRKTKHYTGGWRVETQHNTHTHNHATLLHHHTAHTYHIKTITQSHILI